MNCDPSFSDAELAALYADERVSMTCDVKAEREVWERISLEDLGELWRSEDGGVE